MEDHSKTAHAVARGLINKGISVRVFGVKDCLHSDVKPDFILDGPFRIFYVKRV